MACIRRSLITSTSRARLLFAQERFTNPLISSSYVNNHKQQEDHCKIHQHSRFSTVSGFRDPRWSHFVRHVPVTATNGVGFYVPRRNMSKNAGTFNIDSIVNMADKTMDTVVSSTQAVYNEVAIAAADSWLPVAAWMDALDGIHNFTGLNWWATIVIATVILRTCTVHSKIRDLKVATNIAIMEQQLREKVDNERMSEAVIKELVLNAWRKQAVPCLLSSTIRSVIYGTFHFAVYNMVGMVPSFETGGASWFLNLTTADPLYTLPVLYSYTLWLNFEVNIRNKSIFLQQNRNADLTKNARGVNAALMIPLCSYIPKAFFFYMITSNVYSIVYGLTIRQPAVLKFLNIPILGPPPKSSGSRSKHCHPSTDAQTLQQEEVQETPGNQSKHCHPSTDAQTLQQEEVQETPGNQSKHCHPSTDAQTLQQEEVQETPGNQSKHCHPSTDAQTLQQEEVQETPGNQSKHCHPSTDAQKLQQEEVQETPGSQSKHCHPSTDAQTLQQKEVQETPGSQSKHCDPSTDAETLQQEVQETKPMATDQSTVSSPQASKKTISQEQKSTFQ